MQLFSKDIEDDILSNFENFNGDENSCVRYLIEEYQFTEEKAKEYYYKFVIYNNIIKEANIENKAVEDIKTIVREVLNSHFMDSVVTMDVETKYENLTKRDAKRLFEAYKNLALFQIVNQASAADVIVQNKSGTINKQYNLIKTQNIVKLITNLISLCIIIAFICLPVVLTGAKSFSFLDVLLYVLKIQRENETLLLVQRIGTALYFLGGYVALGVLFIFNIFEALISIFVKPKSVSFVDSRDLKINCIYSVGCLIVVILVTILINYYYFAGESLLHTRIWIVNISLVVLFILNRIIPALMTKEEKESKEVKKVIKKIDNFWIAAVSIVMIIGSAFFVYKDVTNVFLISDAAYMEQVFSNSAHFNSYMDISSVSSIKYYLDNVDEDDDYYAFIKESKTKVFPSIKYGNVTLSYKFYSADYYLYQNAIDTASSEKSLSETEIEKLQDNLKNNVPYAYTECRETYNISQTSTTSYVSYTSFNANVCNTNKHVKSIEIKTNSFSPNTNFNNLSLWTLISYEDHSFQQYYFTPSNADELSKIESGSAVMTWSDDWGSYNKVIYFN